MYTKTRRTSNIPSDLRKIYQSFTIDHVFQHGANLISFVQPISRESVPYFSGVKVLMSMVTNSTIPYRIYVHIVDDKHNKIGNGKNDGKPECTLIAPGVEIMYDSDLIK